MATFGNLILRIVVICIAFTLAMVAVGIFIGVGFYSEILANEPPLNTWEEEFFAMVSIGIAVMATMLIGAYSFGIVILVIAVAEFMRWKGMIANVAIGGCCAALLTLVTESADHLDGRIGANSGVLMVALSAGFIGGFVYWLVAGRYAGDWLGPTTARSSKS